MPVETRCFASLYRVSTRFRGDAMHRVSTMRKRFAIAFRRCGNASRSRFYEVSRRRDASRLCIAFLRGFEETRCIASLRCGNASRSRFDDAETLRDRVSTRFRGDAMPRVSTMRRRDASRRNEPETRGIASLHAYNFIFVLQLKFVVLY